MKNKFKMLMALKELYHDTFPDKSKPAHKRWYKEIYLELLGWSCNQGLITYDEYQELYRDLDKAEDFMAYLAIKDNEQTNTKST